MSCPPPRLDYLKDMRSKPLTSWKKITGMAPFAFVAGAFTLATLALTGEALTHEARAAERTYALAPPSGHPTGIRFRLPYTLGTHDGEALEATGTATFDPASRKAIRGSFRVPIRSIRTGNDARDCHLLEALGLDYAKSGYPEDHVCDGDDHLPSAGPDAIAYPDIEFRARALREEKNQITAIEGDWVIHGVSRPARIAVTATPEGEGFRLKGETRISLKDHGIEVKSAKILFATIRVEDQAVVSMDLRLQPR